MNIEKKVGSQNFRSSFHKAMVNLYVSYKWFEQHTDEVFKAHGLLSQHFNLLKIVKGKSEPCSIKEIREVMMDKGRDLTRLIDKLESKGLVIRELNPENRRQMRVAITAAGSELLAEVDQRLMAKIEEINDLTEAEATQLNHLLNKLRAPT